MDLVPDIVLRAEGQQSIIRIPLYPRHGYIHVRKGKELTGPRYSDPAFHTFIDDPPDYNER